MPENYIPQKSYYVFSTGTDFKPRAFATRVQAETAMNLYCKQHNIQLELTEDDKHEKKYSDHKGTRFYINRI